MSYEMFNDIVGIVRRHPKVSWVSQISNLILNIQPSVKFNKKRPMGVYDLLNNTVRSSKHIVMYDKQMYQIILQIILNASDTPFMFY